MGVGERVLLPDRTMAQFNFLVFLFVSFLENQVEAEEITKLQTSPTDSLQTSNNQNKEADGQSEQKEKAPVDWKPQENCYFCVDGKLLTVNERGDLVAESGPVQAEPELANNRVSCHYFFVCLSDVIYFCNYRKIIFTFFFLSNFI